MTNIIPFADFFQGKALSCLKQSINLALEEDGPDLTSLAVFEHNTLACGHIVTKQKTAIAGLPVIALIFEAMGEADCDITLHAKEGTIMPAGSTMAEITSTATALLRAERVILNFVGHLCGVTNLTRQYVKQLEGSTTTLLDTRKTLPGLRYVQKYAVQLAGAKNHRMNLSQMLMLKDNHIDQAGSMTQAVQAIRNKYNPCPPLEVECRNKKEVLEAVNLKVDRIMLDNMPVSSLQEVLATIAEDIETEVSGNVSLDNIKEISQAGPDFISVGRLTHSAINADLSMKIHLKN